MKVYDISQEVFSCRVYPGDAKPEKHTLRNMEQGDTYNLTAFTMYAHNGTHVDAPYHFFKDGITVDEMGLDTFVGECFVARQEGNVTGEVARNVLKKAEGACRILLAGSCTVTEEAASVFADSNIKLLGNESQSVGPLEAPRKVHLILLGKGIALLEGIELAEVPEGHYILSAAPLNLGGADGAPCRACLISL